MAIRTTLNVSLSLELGEYIEEQIRKGRYRTASELVRTALRLLQDKDRRAEKNRPGSATAATN